MIIRRHRCETCNVIYECEACCDYAEEQLDRKLVMNHGHHDNAFANGNFTSPDCMKKFECEDCQNARQERVQNPSYREKTVVR